MPEYKKFPKISDSFTNRNLSKRRNYLALVVIWLLSAGALCYGADDNLIMNGSLDSEQADFPPFWYTEMSNNTRYDRSGGPNGKGAIILTRTANIRQGGLELVPGEKYKLSGMFKTSRFKPRAFMFVVHNSGWKQQVGISSVPENTYRWVKLEQVITIMPSLHPSYGIAVHVADAQGELRITDLKLEPLTDKARALSKNPIATPTRLIIPWQPRLNYIPVDNPYLSFAAGKNPPPGKTYQCRYQVDSMPEKQCDVPANSIFTLDLHDVPTGDHKLRTTLVESGSNQTVAEENFEITLITSPEIKTDQWKRRNNLVTELLSISDVTGTEHAFYAPYDGWIRLESTPGSKIKLDGEPLPEMPEMFRQVKGGLHMIGLESENAGTLTVTSVPEILSYPTFFRGNEFAEKYALKNTNVANQALGAAVPPLYKKYGGIMVSNYGIFKAPCTTESMLGYWEKIYSRYVSEVNGVAMDECFFTSPQALGDYARFLRQLKNPNDKLIYTWIVGKPTTILHTDFMTTAINVTKGRGRLLCESYCIVHDTRAEQQNYLNDMLCGTMAKYKRFCPEAETATSMVLGVFSRGGFYSLNSRPNVDFKYALDMEMNMLANHPEFKNLRGLGCYEFNYADEEISRWAYALLRHYAIDGKKDMLSDRFGFAYNPGLLKNGDFVQGFSNWYKSGSVTAEKQQGLYTKIQKRWGNSSDTYALFTKKNNQTAFLKQTVSGLVPGKLYALNFITADLDEIRKERVAIRKYGINVKISGVDILPEKELCLLDDRPEKRNKTPRLNVRKIVFRAQSPQATICFDNAEAGNGEELILNFIQLTPFFELEDITKL